jgi:septal ring factor EnvC (AmiA/AmiB activator)
MDESQVMKLMEKLSELSERIARVEAMLQANHNNDKAIAKTLADHDERIGALEQSRASAMSYKEVIAWLTVTGIALWGVLK